MGERIDVKELAQWDGLPDVKGNIARRRIRFDFPGQLLPGHEHNYAHATAVVAGAVIVRLYQRDGSVEQMTLRAPELFTVPANVRHELKALEPGTECWCLFAVRDADGEVVDKPTIEHLRDPRWHERKDR